MKQRISTLMDGELCGDEAELLLGKFKLYTDAHQDWVTYHLIGDVLRQPDYVPVDISATIIERLYAEPTVLAPQTKRSSKASYFAMSAVASIMAMAFLAWLSAQIDSVPAYQQARQRSNDVRTVSLPANEAVNDYLLAHQEFSPGGDVRGAASYIRSVAYTQPGAGK
jgi:sigma-E factor negative regulatory protein RseA